MGRIMKRRGPVRRHIIDDRMVDRIVKLDRDGVCQRDIAMTCHISQGAVSRTLISQGRRKFIRVQRRKVTRAKVEQAPTPAMVRRNRSLEDKVIEAAVPPFVEVVEVERVGRQGDFHVYNLTVQVSKLLDRRQFQGLFYAGVERLFEGS